MARQVLVLEIPQETAFLKTNFAISITDVLRNVQKVKVVGQEGMVMELLVEIAHRVNFAIAIQNVLNNARNLISVVAQEMGLGKQKETVHLIAYVSPMECAGVCLVICSQFKEIIIH